MKTKNKEKTISVSSNKTLPISAQRLHVNKQLLLDIDNLSIRLGSELIIDNASFCIHKGEFIGLIGSNGAGKTTLLRAVLGLIHPTGGKISRQTATIGYIPQRGALYSGVVPISVWEVVRLGARHAPERVMSALTQVGLSAEAHKRFNELSGGQQQRVILAKALASNADILILDEPTTGIDEQSQTAFYQLLQSLRDQGVTIVMVSHEVDTVLTLVTRVICLNRTILYDGPPEHFEADTYLPQAYSRQHMQLHHHHKATDTGTEE